ncbi:MAG: hypothetical protein IPM24_19650 [Bryobacterales bacterium]|nr:hypothetical protein [Bryobacterales bacterium]
MECAIAQSQIDEAWQKIWGNQPLPDDPAEHDEIASRVLAETWVADASGSRILERLQKHAAIVERQIARSSACCAARCRRNKIAKSNPFRTSSPSRRAGKSPRPLPKLQKRTQFPKHPAPAPRPAPAASTSAASRHG